MDSHDASHDEHAVWEARAMAHVMGGLDPDTSSAFRHHLLGCAHCKAHVRELRDLAGSLQLAARDEQSLQAIRLASRTSDDTRAPSPGPEPVTVSGKVLAFAVATALVIGLLVFSAMQQAREAAAATAIASEQATTLATLGAGLPLDDVVLRDGASGVLVSDGDMIGWSLSSLPVSTGREWLAVWLVTNGRAELVSSHPAGDGPPGTLTGSVRSDEAQQLVVTYGRADDLVTPVADDALPGDQVVVADLTQFRAGEG